MSVFFSGFSWSIYKFSHDHFSPFYYGLPVIQPNVLCRRKCFYIQIIFCISSFTTLYSYYATLTLQSKTLQVFCLKNLTANTDTGYVQSCNNVALPYFTLIFTEEDYNSVGSLLWRKNISIHYLFFLMICKLCYPEIVNISHSVVAVSQKYQYFKKLETATLLQLICSVPVQASIFLLLPPGLRQTFQEWQTPKWSPSFEKSYPEINFFSK